MDMDVSAPLLVGSFGDDLGKAKVDFTTAFDGRSKPYFQMEFEHVQLTGLSIGGSSDDWATLQGSFSYRKIKMTYTSFDEAGRPKETSSEFRISENIGSVGELGLLYSMGVAGPPTIPEAPLPGTLGLLGGGLALLIAYARRRR